MGAVDQCLQEGVQPGETRHVSPESVRENWARAERVLQRSRNLCLAAQMTRGKARVERDKYHWLRSEESLLPPLEYVLPSLDVALANLGCGLPPLEVVLEEMAGENPVYRRPAKSVLYVWGYGLSYRSIIQRDFRATEAARRFAAERGWDGRRPGAWAGEQAFPMGLRAALKKMESMIRADHSVAGWGGRIVRAT